MAYAIELPNGMYLIVMDPQPIFPEDAARAFWDGQPRKPDGRFTFGKMQCFVLRSLPQGWFGEGRGTGVRATDAFQDLRHVELQHKKIPGDVYFFKKGVKHTLGTHDTVPLEKLMRSPGIITAVFPNAVCKEQEVKPDKSHYADRAWNLHMSIKLDGVSTRMDIVVLHHTKLKRNVIYDITLRTRKRVKKKKAQE